MWSQPKSTSVHSEPVRSTKSETKRGYCEEREGPVIQVRQTTFQRDTRSRENFSVNYGSNKKRKLYRNLKTETNETFYMYLRRISLILTKWKRFHSKSILPANSVITQKTTGLPCPSGDDVPLTCPVLNFYSWQLNLRIQRVSTYLLVFFWSSTTSLVVLGFSFLYFLCVYSRVKD